ncbi:MAG: hypothetical protein PVF58_20255 [Candidatus Methanofastidiosia archaeon]|jgi:hypothetical protein
MKKIAAGITTLCLLLSVTSIWAPTPERVIIVFHTTPDVGMIAQHGDVLQVFNLIPAVVAMVPQPGINALSKNPNVSYIQADYYRQYVQQGPPGGGPLGQGDEQQELPWGVDRIDADLAWSTSKGTGVK